MNLSDIVSILQIGFSGFAFLLAGMSYKLLRDETNRQGAGRKTILEAIIKYTKYTLAIAILVIIAKIGEKGLDYYFEYKKSLTKIENIRISTEADNCRGALSRLINAESKVNKDYQSLLTAIQEACSNCENVFRQLGQSDQSE